MNLLPDKRDDLFAGMLGLSYAKIRGLSQLLNLPHRATFSWYLIWSPLSCTAKLRGESIWSFLTQIGMVLIPSWSANCTRHSAALVMPCSMGKSTSPPHLGNNWFQESHLYARRRQVGWTEHHFGGARGWHCHGGCWELAEDEAGESG